MKKCLLVLVLCLICCISATAMAAGKLNVTQENFHKIDMYSAYGYLYAKVENVGDKPIKVNAGLLEIYDENGDPLTSTDYINAYVTYLEPGAYTYVSAHEDVDAGLDAIDDYMFTVSGKSDNETKVITFPCETSYDVDDSNPYWKRNYMYATFTNTSDSPIYGLEVVVALLDAEGNILYVESESMYDSKALHAGSTMTVRIDVSSSFIEYYEANGLVPASVDAIAYAELN